MSKKHLLLFSVSFVLIIFSVGTVLAANPIKLIINGHEINNPLVPLQVVANRVVVPVRQVAEALGATVEWDDANQTVSIINKKQTDNEKRLNQLEFALISQSPEEVANTWARGVMSRNGALQYAVMSDNLQSKYKSDFETWDWLTGASSPWVDSYKLSNGEQQSDGTWKYKIDFHFTDSTKADYIRTSNIHVGLKRMENPPLPVYPGTEQKWCILAIE